MTEEEKARMDEINNAHSAAWDDVKFLRGLVDRQPAELERMRGALEACADALEEEVRGTHGVKVDTKLEEMHPVSVRRFERDMAPVREARAALQPSSTGKVRTVKASRGPPVIFDPDDDQEFQSCSCKGRNALCQVCGGTGDAPTPEVEPRRECRHDWEPTMSGKRICRRCGKPEKPGLKTRRYCGRVGAIGTQENSSKCGECGASWTSHELKPLREPQSKSEAKRFAAIADETHRPVRKVEGSDVTVNPCKWCEGKGRIMSRTSKDQPMEDIPCPACSPEEAEEPE